MRKNIPIVSLRAKKAPFSSIRKFVPLLEEAKKRGLEVFELHIGQPDLETPKEILDRIKNFKEKRISYTPSEGILETRKAWQKYYQGVGINFDLSEIIITNGGSEATIFAFAVLCSPGEEIIVFEPTYLYQGYASLVGIKLVPVRTFFENNFHLPEQSVIEKKITKKTKGILICNPNNPTGTVYSKEELKMVVDIAQKHNLFILSDEVYRELVFDGKRHCSIMDFKEVHQRAILLDSVSKRFSACGLRMGCLASKNRRVMEGVLKFAQARLSPQAIGQEAIIPLLLNPKAYTKKIQKEYQKRRDAILEELQKIPSMKASKPAGAFYILLKLPIKDGEDFTQWLLTKFNFQGKTLMVAPGEGFYISKNLGKDEIRLSLVLPPAKLKEAAIVLKKGIEEYLASESRLKWFEKCGKIM